MPRFQHEQMPVHTCPKSDKEQKSLLNFGMVGLRVRNRKGIPAHRRSLLEADHVLAQIRFCLGGVPPDSEAHTGNVQLGGPTRNTVASNECKPLPPDEPSFTDGTGISDSER